MLDANSHTTPDGRSIGDTVLDLRHITLRFAELEPIKDISFDVSEGEIRATDWIGGSSLVFSKSSHLGAAA